MAQKVESSRLSIRPRNIPRVAQAVERWPEEPSVSGAIPFPWARFQCGALGKRPARALQRLGGWLDSITRLQKIFMP